MVETILTGLCLVLVFEGIAPFINPGAYRALMLKVAQMGDRELRTIGIISMTVGVVALMLLR